MSAANRGRNASRRCVGARQFLVGAVAVAAVTACDRKSTCEPRADHSVVACIGTEPVTRDEVEPHMRGGTPDAQRDALDSALRVRLFAAEAERLGLAGGGRTPAHRRASLYQAFRRHVAKRERATRDDVSDAEARQYYTRHPGRFNKITATHCRAIFIDDEARAKQLAATVRDADEQAFADAARRSSVHPSAADGGLIPETHAPDTDAALTRASNDLRDVGQVIGPVALDAGGYAILFASRLDMQVKPYDDVASHVRNRIARDREQTALARELARVRDATRVVVFDDALQHVTAPRTAVPSPPE